MPAAAVVLSAAAVEAAAERGGAGGGEGGGVKPEVVVPGISGRLLFGLWDGWCVRRGSLAGLALYGVWGVGCGQAFFFVIFALGGHLTLVYPPVFLFCFSPESKPKRGRGG